MPNQYTRKPRPGDVVKVSKKCATCGRNMVANFMGEDAWCPFCKAQKAKSSAAADQIAKAWGR